ncbi:MAG: hypothetical protein ACOC5K_01075 [Chloroflexota bacterium]
MPEFPSQPEMKPAHYSPPTWREIAPVLEKLKRERQPFIDREWETRRALRGQWDQVLSLIPSSYRKILLPPDVPELRDMVYRVSGLIRKRPLTLNVHAPEPRPGAQKKAADEEARLNALRLMIADQHHRDPFDMGIDNQVHYGESWITVWPDPRRMKRDEYKRRDGESARDYSKRYKETMAFYGIPLHMPDHDPCTVFPAFNDDDTLAFVMIETEHSTFNIQTMMGYAPVKNREGTTYDWKTIGPPLIPADTARGNNGRVDVEHDRGTDGYQGASEKPVKKLIYIDPWVYQCWLDGVKVEEWEHNFGYVPTFYARGSDTADRTPGQESRGLIEPALSIAKQVVYYSAMMSSSAAQHGFPTPFLKNPVHGLVNERGEPLTRKVVFGEMNLMGQGEEIDFPYLNANMNENFLQYLDLLNGKMESSTLSNFGKAIGSDIAGYAIAQIRSMQLSVLSPIYRNAERQWRNIAYFQRHLVKEGHVPELYLRGAVEEDEDGTEFRPVLEYKPSDCTSYSITTHIDEGIQQDEIAERKSAIEMKETGIWSVTRAMEHTGVEDPAMEQLEIDNRRVMSSPAFDEVVLRMAVEMASERHEITREESSSPFYQALEKAKQEYMGGGGQFQNQQGAPMNADPAGTPMNQQPSLDMPQGGGPTAGPQGGGGGAGLRQQDMAVPQLPGGVRGRQQTPVRAPG